MTDDRLSAVATRLGRLEHVGQERPPALDLAAGEAEESEPGPRHAEPCCVIRRLCQRRRPLVGDLGLRVRVAARRDERGPEGELKARLACVTFGTSGPRLEQ